MKQIFRDLLFFLLLPFTFGVLFLENQLKITPMEHKLIQAFFMFVIYIIVTLWFQYDIKMKEKEMEKIPTPEKIKKMKRLRQLFQKRLHI